jgi:vancomycin permeability regulator SanA
MKAYMTEKGIPESVVFTDHAGFDTYDTMYRARDIFKAKRVLIVTQDFHISRAVYIARSLGLEAYGYACDGNNTFAGFRNETRETAARAKYVLNSIFKPEPKYLGEEIPIWGDASASNG